MLREEAGFVFASMTLLHTENTIVKQCEIVWFYIIGIVIFNIGILPGIYENIVLFYPSERSYFEKFLLLVQI